MLKYRHGPQGDPFYWLYSSPGWLTDYDPPRAFPIWVNLEPTNICQLDCIFCSRQLSKRPLGYMDLKTAAAIIEEASAHKECGLRLTGWGEPLLHPAIGELVTMIKKAGLPLKIYTNGLALTPELMATFIEMEVDDLQFSMQGLNAAQYEFNRRKASYSKFAAAVEMASKIRGDKARPFLSLLTSVLAHEAAEGHAEAFCEHWLQYVDKVAVDLTNLNFVAETERAKPYLEKQSQGLERRKCVDVFLAQEIKYDGLIQFCGQDADARPEHSLGLVGEITLAQAWHSQKMEEHRNLVGRGLGHNTMTLCANCYHNTSKYDYFKKG